MQNINFYELLYQARMDDEYAIKLLEQEVQPFLINWVNERIRTNFCGSKLYFEDLYLEALMGMLEAIETFREDKSASFITYLKIVVNNRLKNCAKAVLTKTEPPLEKTLSLNLENHYYDGHSQMAMVSENKLNDPSYVLLLKESKDKLDRAISDMSKAERDAMFMYYDGLTYDQASEKLSITYKEYDGRLQKARKKIRTYLNNIS